MSQICMLKMKLKCIIAEW